MPAILTEAEFNAIKTQVLDSAPANMDEAIFNKWASAQMGAAIAQAETEKAGSMGETARRTGAGIVSGVKASLNPMNLVRGPYELAKDVLTNRGRGTLEGLEAIASGDPEAGGEMIGGLLTGGVAGRLIPKLPSAMRTVRNIPNATIPKTATTIGDVVKGTTKAVVTARNPLLRPVLKSIAEEAATRVAREIERPSNVQAAFKAVKDVASKRGVTLSPSDIEAVVKELNATDSVELAPVSPDSWTGGTSGAVPHETRSASFGPRGDLKAYLARQADALPTDVMDSLRAIAHGDAVRLKALMEMYKKGKPAR